LRAYRRGVPLVAQPAAGMRRAALLRRLHRGSAGVHADAPREAMRRTHLPDPVPAYLHGDDEPVVRPGLRRGARRVSLVRGTPAMTQRNLPGDPDPRAAVERIVRVDHAGEYGAVRIYAGQLAVLRRSGRAEVLQHM